MRKTRFYEIWKGIKTRCYNNNRITYKYWGGKGITMCERWLEFAKFKDDMYKKYLEHIEKFGETNTQIDRTDNNKNYCKTNCRWATRKKQCRNKSNNRVVVVKDKKYNVMELAEKIGMNYHTLYNRLFVRKWSLEKALTKKI